MVKETLLENKIARTPCLFAFVLQYMHSLLIMYSVCKEVYPPAITEQLIVLFSCPANTAEGGGGGVGVLVGLGIFK